MKNKAEYQRILIIATRQIGDVLCTTPLMRRTRQLWPSATIDVLGYERTMGMLAGNLDINEIIESPEHPNWAEYKKLIKKIFRKYDLAVVAQPSDRAHFYGFFSAKVRVGITSSRFSHNWWKKILCFHTITLDYWRQHVIIERLRLLEPFEMVGKHKHSVPTISVVPPLPKPLPPDIESFLSSGPTVIIHASPMWKFKRWPIKNWEKLITHLLKTGKNVFLTGSSSEQDKVLNDQIIQSVRIAYLEESIHRLFNGSGLLDLAQTARLMRDACLYVGVDTSITHLAAACGVPTIALFGPTSPPNFGPWPEYWTPKEGRSSIWELLGTERDDGVRLQVVGNVKIIQGPGHCVPCRKAGCRDKFESHSDCLDRLNPDQVIEAVGQ